MRVWELATGLVVMHGAAGCALMYSLDDLSGGQATEVNESPELVKHAATANSDAREPTSDAVIAWLPVANHGAVSWCRGFPAEGEQSVGAVVVDDDGKVWLFANVEATIDLGGEPLESLGFGGDIVVGRFASDGTHLWSRRFGGAGVQQVSAAALDPSGSVVMVGTFQNSLSLDEPLRADGGAEAFIATVQPDGTTLNSASLGVGVTPRDIAINPDGEAFVLASYDQSGQLPQAGYVNRLAADEEQWFLSLQATAMVQPRAITLAPDGSLLLSGDFKGTLTVGDQQVVGDNTHDLFVASADPYGVDDTAVWLHSAGGEGMQTVSDLLVADEALYVAGTHGGTLAFEQPGGSLYKPGVVEPFIAELSLAGDVAASHGYALTGGSTMQRLVAVGGGIVAVGQVGGAVDFGLNAPLTAQKTDMFAAKFSGDLKAADWQLKLEHDGGFGAADAASGGGRVAYAFDYRGTVNCDGTVLDHAGSSDIGLVSIVP